MPVPISNLSAIFANSQQTFVGLGLNVSYTAAATGSRLFELKVNNQPKFWINLDGVPSTNLSSNDSVARTLAQQAYDLASLATGVEQSNVYLTIAGANSAIGTGANAFTSVTIAGANAAVGTGANAFASATVSGANAIAIAAYTRANIPNLSVANTTTGTLSIKTFDRTMMNFIDDSPNTGICVEVTESLAFNASNVAISAYDVLADNVSIAGTSSAIFNNTIITRPYRRFSFFLYEASISASGFIQLRYSVNNGTTPRAMDAVPSIVNTGNLVTCAAFYENAQYLPRTYRRRGFLNSISSDGVSFQQGANFHFTTSDPLSDGYINWLNYFISSGGGSFTGGYVTLIGYR